ncbi:MAG: hypothetical protein JXR59_10735 [Desulfuromonadaceae bacterium]|nr:hypothetical protein [Desulfuromonadaceae bacterium]
MNEYCLLSATAPDSSTRPGWQLNPRFCRWHHFHLRHGVFDRSCDSCPLVEAQQNQHDPNNASHISLADSITLESLIDFLGHVRWECIKEDSSQLKQAIAYLTQHPMSSEPRPGNLFPGAAHPNPLNEACNPLLKLLEPRAKFIGLSQHQVRTGLFGLLKDIAPENANDALVVTNLLGDHFRAMNRLNRLQRWVQSDPERLPDCLGWVDNPPHIPLEAWDESSGRLQTPLGEAFRDFERVLTSCDHLKHLRTKRRYLKDLKADGSLQSLATATSTEYSAELMMMAVIEALNIFGLDPESHTGLTQLLANRSPKDPLEALVMAESLILEHYQGWLRVVAYQAAENGLDLARRDVDKLIAQSVTVERKQKERLKHWR